MATVNMDDLKPNSHQYHKDTETQEQGDQIEKRAKKIVTSPVDVRKKSIGRKFLDIFISEDVGDVKKYLVYDVLVPAIKENIADAVNGAIGMIFFGEATRRNTSGTARNRTGSRVNYGGYFNGGGNGGSERRERMPKSYREDTGGRASTDDIIIASRAEAEQVLDEMRELLDTYKQVTVADYYDMLDITSEFTDHKFGWTDLSDARVIRVRNGYHIDLPRETAL